jgi:hypothetical protein
MSSVRRANLKRSFRQTVAFVQPGRLLYDKARIRSPSASTGDAPFAAGRPILSGNPVQQATQARRRKIAMPPPPLTVNRRFMSAFGDEEAPCLAVAIVETEGSRCALIALRLSEPIPRSISGAGFPHHRGAIPRRTRPLRRGSATPRIDAGLGLPRRHGRPRAAT